MLNNLSPEQSLDREMIKYVVKIFTFYLCSIKSQVEFLLDNDSILGKKIYIGLMSIKSG